MDPWESNISNDFAAVMINDASPALPENDWPVIVTGLTTAEAILAAQVDAVLAEGFGANGVTNDAVFGDLEGYRIFNYWSQADYEDLGHIPGSYQVDPTSVSATTLTTGENLSAFYPGDPNVLYCWTGQTSAMTTFYLNVMGYDMLSLKFGANGMMYDELPSHVWPTGGYPDWNYDYVTGPLVTEFDILTEYTDTMFEGWTSGWIQGADYVHENMADLFIIDLRSEADFNNGHIENAHNVTLDTMLDDVETNNTDALTVAVVCYSGQTAAYAVMALRMMGYEDAFSMKFGMSAWNTQFMGPWETSIGSTRAGDFVTTTSPALPSYDAPVLTTAGDTGMEILANRVLEVLGEGYMGLTHAEVYDDLESYSIYNYWEEADYTDLGHIDGAYQLDPGTLISDENLLVLDPDGENVIYCWTGQTGSLTACYLNVLGYTVYNLKYGVNAMIYDQLTSHIWPTGGYPDWNYPYVTE